MSAPMPAERIAELRDVTNRHPDGHDGQIVLECWANHGDDGCRWHERALDPEWDEMLDEIERLRWVVAEAHELRWSSYTWGDRKGVADCRGCAWRREGPITFIRAAEDHAAHVDALVPGWKP